MEFHFFPKTLPAIKEIQFVKITSKRTKILIKMKFLKNIMNSYNDFLIVKSHT